MVLHLMFQKILLKLKIQAVICKIPGVLNFDETIRRPETENSPLRLFSLTKNPNENQKSSKHTKLSNYSHAQPIFNKSVFTSSTQESGLHSEFLTIRLGSFLLFHSSTSIDFQLRISIIRVFSNGAFSKNYSIGMPLLAQICVYI